uniref:Uncharacterized protein n=1 Tax=Cacopsylla melanoneura TaxID=428564 RepID=A0A8D8T8R9_9HEMI
MACMQPDQAQLMQMKLIETVRNLSGVANNFVSESNILNALSGFNLAGIAKDSVRMVLGSLVQANKLECFVPMTQLGSCGCGGDCGSCGGGCCGSGRYYRIKIG